MPKDNVVRQLGKYYGIVFLLPASILVGWIIGYFLDKVFGTQILKIVFLFLGVAAGIIEQMTIAGCKHKSGAVSFFLYVYCEGIQYVADDICRKISLPLAVTRQMSRPFRHDGGESIAQLRMPGLRSEG